jgi:sulfur-oxidizing protein SoxX
MRTLMFGLLVPLAAGAAFAQGAAYTVVGDGIPQALTKVPGNAARGRALIVKREAANCLKCHTIKDKDMAGGGDKGPPLDGVGATLTVPQLRLSVADMTTALKKDTPMPSFHKAGADDAAPKLAAQEIEDVVAYLRSLKK